MPKASQLSAEAVKLFQEPQLAHFVTVMPDGSPQVTPVWVDVADDGSEILINTAEGRTKARNTEQNAEVAVSVVDKHNDFRWVTVRGTVADRRHEGANEHIDKLAKKYLGLDIYPNHRPDEQRVIIAIKPHNVVEQVGEAH